MPFSRNQAVKALPAQAWFPLSALGFIGLLFALKYGPRTGISPGAAGSGYAVFFLASTLSAAALVPFIRSRSNSWGWVVCAGAAYVVILAAAYARVPAETLRLDRASAIGNFWGALFRGEYPYSVPSHLNNPISGFPMLMVAALPFVLLGDVGLLQFAALAAFLGLLAARFRDAGTALVPAAALLCLPAFAYEVLARSDLFANMVLVAVMLHFALRPGAARGARLWIWAAAWGLALSTRSAVAAPFLFAAVPLLRGRSLPAALAFFALTGLTFALTFAPFWLWDPALFLEHNPLDVQGFYMPTWGGALLLALSAALAWRDRENPRPFARAGFLLFLTVLACGIAETLKSGSDAALWGSLFNITYFTLAVPFLVIDLGDRLTPSRGSRATD